MIFCDMETFLDTRSGIHRPLHGQQHRIGNADQKLSWNLTAPLRTKLKQPWKILYTRQFEGQKKSDG